MKGLKYIYTLTHSMNTNKMLSMGVINLIFFKIRTPKRKMTLQLINFILKNWACMLVSASSLLEYFILRIKKEVWSHPHAHLKRENSLNICKALKDHGVHTLRTVKITKYLAIKHSKPIIETRISPIIKGKCHLS